jgi:TolB protein
MPVRSNCTLPLLLLAACVSRTSDSPETTPANAPVVAESFPDVRTLLWEPGIKNAYPRWSKDGRRILYQSNRSGKWQICAMDADGTHSRPLTSGAANDNFPDWSPDDERIAFVSDRDGNEEVYVMKADGSELRNVSNHPARDIHPYWAPDGEKLLFNSTRDGAALQIYEVNRDGTGLRRLVTSPDDDTCARIAPKGDRFVYLANLATGQDDVLMRDRDGTNPVNLTNDRAPDGWPTWVPDGRRIVFSSARTGTFRLFAMELEGRAVRQLTSAEVPYSDARACVSRDGKKIVFNRDRGDTIGICVVDLRRSGSGVSSRPLPSRRPPIPSTARALPGSGGSAPA